MLLRSIVLLIDHHQGRDSYAPAKNLNLRTYRSIAADLHTRGGIMRVHQSLWGIGHDFAYGLNLSQLERYVKNCF